MPFLIAAAIATLLLIGAGWYFSGLVLRPRLFGYDETWDIEVGKGRIDPAWWNSLPAEEVWIDSPFDYKIHAVWVPGSASKRTVILVHGITYTLWGSVKYMPLFWNRGFNVLLIDNRHHGKSGGRIARFGFRERWDVKACVDWVYGQTGQDSIVGLHGESMGAAIVLQLLRSIHASGRPFGLRPRRPFRGTGDTSVTDYKLPDRLFVPIASLVTRLRAGFCSARCHPSIDVAASEFPSSLSTDRTTTMSSPDGSATLQCQSQWSQAPLPCPARDARSVVLGQQGRLRPDRRHIPGRRGDYREVAPDPAGTGAIDGPSP